MYLQPVYRQVLATLILMLLGAFWCAVAAAASHAGQIMFTFGNVTITGANGAVRPAARGEQIFSGETVTTAAGRVQIRFTDGSLISLIPNTAYKIDEYQYSGQVDGSERGFFRLIKGGLRTVTGAIGRGDKENYRLTTPVATIGIRGTWFRALLDEFGRLLVSVGFDPDDPSGLIVANAVGQIELNRGENAVVENADTPPVRTEQQVVIEPPPPPEEPLFVVSDERDESGTQSILGEQGEGGTVPVPVPVAPPALLTNGVAAVSDNATLPPAGVGSDSFESGAFIGSPVIAAFGVEKGANPSNNFATIDINRALQVSDAAVLSQVQAFVNAADSPDVSFFNANPAQVAESSTIDNVLILTRWSGGRVLTVNDEGGSLQSEVDDLTGFQSWHLIGGPTPTGALPAPSSGIFTYNFAGGTNSTSESGATIGNGVVSGTLFIDAGGSTPFVQVNMTVQHAATYTVFADADFSGFAFGTQFGGIGDASTATGGSACNPICNVNIDGTFSGDGSPPSHAGLVYIINENDKIHGAAAFRK